MSILMVWIMASCGQDYRLENHSEVWLTFVGVSQKFAGV